MKTKLLSTITEKEEVTVLQNRVGPPLIYSITTSVFKDSQL